MSRQFIADSMFQDVKEKGEKGNLVMSDESKVSFLLDVCERSESVSRLKRVC